MKKRIATIMLCLMFAIQSMYSYPIMSIYAADDSGQTEMADIQKDNKLDEYYEIKDYKLVPPEGKTMDEVKAGDTVKVEITAVPYSNEGSRYITIRANEGYLQWNYTPDDKTATPYTIRTEGKTEFKNVSGHSADWDTVDVRFGEEFTAIYTVKLNEYMLSGTATLKSIYIQSRDYWNDKEELKGYYIRDGKMIQIHDEKEGTSVDYDKKLDFSIKEADNKDNKRPVIESLNMETEDPIYSSTEMEWKLRYSDDLSGVKNAELEFSNGKHIFSLKESVEDSGSKSGELIFKKTLGNLKEGIGSYKLVKATISDYAGNIAMYQLNTDQTKLTGDNGKSLNAINFNIQYQQRGLIVTKVRFLRDGEEVNNYKNDQEMEVEVTLRNNTEETIKQLYDTSVSMTSTDEKENAGFEIRQKGIADMVDIEAGKEITLHLKESLSNHKNTEYKIEEISAGRYYDEGERRMKLEYYPSQDNIMLNDGNLVESTLDVSNIRIQLYSLIELDKDAPYLSKIEENNSVMKVDGTYEERSRFNIYLDEDTLGDAGLKDVSIELYDTKRPEKNVYVPDSTYLDRCNSEGSEWAVGFFPKDDLVESTYKLKSILLTDENNNQRKYALCSDGKLGEVVNGHTPTKGTIDNLTFTVENPRKPDADFDGPVLNSIHTKINDGYDYDKNRLSVEMNVSDTTGVSDVEVYLTDGKEVTQITGAYDVEYNGSEIKMNFTGDSSDKHTDKRLHHIVLKDKSVRENISTYIYDAASKTLCKDSENVKVEGGDFVFKPHTYGEEKVIKKATPQMDGYKGKICEEPGCGEVKKGRTICKPDGADISDTYFNYDGETHVPYIFNIVGKDGELPRDSYELTYPEDAIEPGTYYITVRFKGDEYEGRMQIPYYIRGKKIQIASISCNDELLDSKNQITFTILTEWKEPISDMILTFSDGKTLKSVKQEKDSYDNYNCYIFTYDTSALGKGNHILNKVTVYDNNRFKEDGMVYDYIDSFDGQYFYNEECDYIVSCDKINIHNHTIVENISKASPNKKGKITSKCESCNYKKEKDILSPKTVTLQTSSYVYDGKVKKPTVKVTDTEGKSISSSNYNIIYDRDCKNVGRYKVTVEFKGNYYEGSLSKTFDIIPKGTSFISLKPKKKSVTVKWKKQVSQTNGYVIQYSISKKFAGKAKSNTVKGSKVTSKKISKLASKKKYYVRIRTYKNVKFEGKNYKFYSMWSGAKSVKVK